ncbi:MAG: hypothetical protein AB7P07_09370 [Hyphomonadaceae bacterium]
MRAAAPMRFLTAALWPLAVWTSFTRFNDHAADDYVERTFPIIATAICFWICVAAVLLFGGGGTFAVFDEAGAIETVRRSAPAAIGALWLALPVLYVIGFWLFTAREERYGG